MLYLSAFKIRNLVQAMGNFHVGLGKADKNFIQILESREFNMKNVVKAEGSVGCDKFGTEV